MPGALYERHVVFDHVVRLDQSDPRQRFEAVALALRDVLSQRWLKTDATYDRANPKQVYYLSMEFLIGRSLASNVLNLRSQPVMREAMEREKLDWDQVVEMEPDAGLGNGGLGRLAACFLDSMATLQIPAIGYGLRYEYGIFRQEIADGRQVEHPDHWLRRPDPWEVSRPREAVDVGLNCAFKLTDGKLEVVANVPTTLIGTPYDRPIVGYGGRTINTLRLWGAATHHDFNFLEFSRGDFFDAVHEKVAAESLTRVLYPDDSTARGKGLRFVQEYFLVACSLADIIARFRRRGNDWRALPEKVAIQLNDTHPALAVAELMRILLDQARLGWDEAWDLTVRTLAYTNHTLLPEALETWPIGLFETRPAQASRDHLRGEPSIPGRCSYSLPWRRGSRPAHQPDSGEPREARQDGASGRRGLAQHQRRGRDPFATAARNRAQGPGRAIPRSIQQQDQRRDAETLASAGKP